MFLGSPGQNLKNFAFKFQRGIHGSSSFLFVIIALLFHGFKTLSDMVFQKYERADLHHLFMLGFGIGVIVPGDIIFSYDSTFLHLLKGCKIIFEIRLQIVFKAPKLENLLPSRFLTLLDEILAHLWQIAISVEPFGKGVLLQPKFLIALYFISDLLLQFSLIKFNQHYKQVMLDDLLIHFFLERLIMLFIIFPFVANVLERFDAFLKYSLIVFVQMVFIFQPFDGIVSIIDFHDVIWLLKLLFISCVKVYFQKASQLHLSGWICKKLIKAFGY